MSNLVNGNSKLILPTFMSGLDLSGIMCQLEVAYFASFYGFPL